MGVCAFMFFVVSCYENLIFQTKTNMKNFKPSMSFIASLALAAIVVVPVFAAGPFAAPPGNMVDAEFNSVTAVGDLSGANVTAVGNLKGATVQTDTGYFLNGGVQGTGNMGGSFTGVSKGVMATASAGIGGSFAGSTFAVSGMPNSDTGTAAQFLGPSGINRVTLGTPLSAIDANGPVKVTGNTTITGGTVNMNGLNVDALGQISKIATGLNPSTTVTVNGNLSAAGTVTATGAIVNGNLSATGNATVGGNLSATKIKAGSIGNFVTQLGSSSTLANTSPYILYALCPGTSTPISCSFYGDPAVSIIWSYANPSLNRCEVKVKTSVFPVTAGAIAVCWDTATFKTP